MIAHFLVFCRIKCLSKYPEYPYIGVAVGDVREKASECEINCHSNKISRKSLFLAFKLGVIKNYTNLVEECKMSVKNAEWNLMFGISRNAINQKTTLTFHFNSFNKERTSVAGPISSPF